MRQMTTIVLIGFAPDAHEVGSDPVAVRRSVKAQEMSLSLTERYQAAGTGLAPEAKLLIPYSRDYQDCDQRGSVQGMEWNDSQYQTETRQQWKFGGVGDGRLRRPRQRHESADSG